MMKTIYIYIGLIILLMGCSDILDVQPTDIISVENVKKDPALVEALLFNIYDEMRFQSGLKNGNNYGGFNTERNEAYLGVVAGELVTIAGWQDPFVGAMKIIDENGAHRDLEYWPYDNIRAANEILEILENATFEEELIKQKSAEARWLRAFMYFELVKRYGGVPLITKAQSIDLPVEELMVSRNTEKEIYDFIAEEMDDIVNILPDSYGSDGFGLPTKWAAYALKSRAMLYAGSIAKNGTVQLNGIIGIPSEEAAGYFAKAYEASMEVINNSPHSLYKGNPDPVENYSEIFINPGNSEIIFAEIYDLSLLKVHSWNTVTMPDAFASYAASNHSMYLESFEKYEYQDGSSGKLDWSQLDGITRFDKNELLLKKDPRFLASAFYPESMWQGGTVYFHGSTVGTIPPESDWPEAGRFRDRKVTGFLIRKRVDESIKQPTLLEDETDWIVFRTAEMYLNAAEAAYETDATEAERLINIIRERAAMPPKENLTIEDIRNERFVELFNEEHRYWDLRRWRIAVDELNGKGFHGVVWTYYIDEDRYTMTLKDADFGQVRSFAERNYYLPIGLERISENTNLIENPGY